MLERQVQNMFSRNHGGKGIDTRAKPAQSGTAPATAMSVEELFAKTLLPLFQARIDGADTEQIALQVPFSDRLDISFPETTSFIFDEYESARNMIAQLKQDCPRITKDKAVFIAYMGDIYDSLCC